MDVAPGNYENLIIVKKKKIHTLCIFTPTA